MIFYQIELISYYQQQYQKYLNKREYVSCKKDFKKEWKKFENVKINNFYLTDTTRWIYGYLLFVCNRFFICKHLI
jgi:predicted metal-dependent hydrolase